MRSHTLLLLVATTAVFAPSASHSSCTEQGPPSWWEAETAMGPGGTLILTAKPWWDRAQGLKTGEQLTVQSEHPGGGRMLVRRERVTRRGGKQVDAINKMEAFINSVQAQRGNKIPEADADDLIAEAEAIIAMMLGI